MTAPETLTDVLADARIAIDIANSAGRSLPNDDVACILDRIESALASAEPVAWQRRTDVALDGNYDDWCPISKEEYGFRLAILAGRDSCPMAGSLGCTQNPLREDKFGWPEQVRALYDHAQSAAKVEALCSDCPPVGYPTDATRCTPCPRNSPTPASVPDVAGTLCVYRHLGGDDGECEYHFSRKVPPGKYDIVKQSPSTKKEPTP